jgi:hypothetical protein
MSKDGLAAVRERIRQAFVTQVHGDVRDAAQVRASREMLAEIAKPVEPLESVQTHIEQQFAKVHADLAKTLLKKATPQIERSSIDKTANEYGIQEAREFRIRSKRLYRDAFRTGLHSRAVRRDQLRFIVEDSTETASELIAAALKGLER